MPKKQETKKRRVAAAQQVARQQAAAAKAERRRRLIVGGIVGFLALALIAPLTAGLILNNTDPELPPVTTTSIFDLPWATGEFAGATLTTPTPCPTTDGTAERTTEFITAPPLCVDPGAVYELTFETAVGSFTLPLDTAVNEEVANLGAVFGWYKTYEQTPVNASTGGLLWVGSPGDAGFTLPVTPTETPINERYPVGSVLAIPGINGGTTGALMVVLDDEGADAVRLDPRYVQVGTIDDLTDHRAVFDSPEASTTLLVDSVSVAKAG